MKMFRDLLLCLGFAAAAMAAAAVHAQAPAEIAVVVMHGKASAPNKAVAAVASALQAQGFQVANLEMPWSGRREYDVDMAAAVDEVTRAFEALRAKGARKFFVAGHSQGGLFAAHYAGVHKVDGVVAIAPGGQVDMAGFFRALGEHVAKARKMVADGKGGEKAGFGDFEGRRGTTSVRTTAATYLSWFDPSGAHTTGAFGKVKEGTPVLYVAPTRDYPALARIRDSNFSAVPKHPASRLLEVDADHMGAPAAAARAVGDWIRGLVAE